MFAIILIRLSIIFNVRFIKIKYFSYMLSMFIILVGIFFLFEVSNIILTEFSARLLRCSSNSVFRTVFQFHHFNIKSIQTSEQIPNEIKPDQTYWKRWIKRKSASSTCPLIKKTLLSFQFRFYFIYFYPLSSCC